MIEKAIERKNLDWLMYVWAFGKNYLGIRRSNRKKFVSYEMLFRKIQDYYERMQLFGEDTTFIRSVCNWKLT